MIDEEGNEIKEFAIPDGVTSIDSKAFYNCSSLTSVTIPNSVTSIGSSAFYNCSSLTSVTIPNSITSIGSSAFIGCSSLQSIVVGNGVTSLPDYVFGTGNSLKSLTIGTGVLSINSNAFRNGDYYYKPVKTIWLTNTPPNGYGNAAGTVNYVANNLYTNLNNKIEYPFLSSMFEVDGVKYVPVRPSDRTCDAIDCLYDESATNVNIGEKVSYRGVEMTVKGVRQYACYRNRYINNVELSFNGDVEDNAFYGCTNIGQVSATNGGNIGASAFQGITSVFTANINNSGYLGEKAFYGSTGLKTLQVGSNVTDIKVSAFYGCTGLTIAQLTNKGSIGASAFQGCKAMTSATLGEAVTSIGNEAFSGCSLLQSIIIPNAVTSIGRYAFSDCLQMVSANIGTAVKTIGTSAFSGCSSLPKIEIPQSVTDIQNYVFQGCTSLRNVVMADRSTILSLGSNGSSPLFSSCPLDSVYIGGNISYNTGSNYGYSPFYRNTSLRTVVITDKETEISDNEFYGCTNLQDVKIGDGVESFGNWAFSGCSSLKKFSFGMNVEQIGKEAFSDCTAMEAITSRSPEPPVCGSQALDDINKWNCTLTVPAGNMADYQAADQWKEFFFIVEGEPVYKYIAINIEKNDGGKVLINGTETPERIKKGSDVELQFVPDEGHSLGQAVVNGEDITEQVVESRYTVTEVNGDLTIKATFTVNQYTLTYIVDGEEYKTYEVDYGTAITPEAAPEKEGYSFSGWSKIPETMPAHDVTVTGTFSVNHYTLTYLVDGETYKTFELDFGTAIPPEDTPEKEGYSFSGWSEIPETMPAHDVTVAGTFSVNHYTLTYIVDGEVYKTYEVDYGAAITPEAAPEREGYTFCGWSEIPETMPAHDVTVTGTFNINSYTLTYMIDGEVYKTYEVVYGAAITPEATPEREGYTFSGWGMIPETMPAYDVIVTGTFSINSYTLTYMIGDEVYKQVVYEYGAAITPEPQPEGDYITFEWVDLPETMPAHDVVVYANFESGIVDIMALVAQGRAHIYTVDGKPLGRLQKGLNIVVMQNGTVRKVYVK